MKQFSIKIILTFALIIFPFKSVLFGGNNMPSFEEGVIYLSEYIASDNFVELSNSNNDQALVDSLFKRSLRFYKGDISEALLALTFATLPFNKMPVTIPFFNIRISLRLPAVDEKLFKIKKNNLPGIVYFDSRTKGGQDKDKVAHFFGNAFLAYNIPFINASKILGILVELFESSFKVSGGVDFRDLQTNGLGEAFGNALRKNNKLLPSQFFKIYSLFYFSYN